MYGLTFEDDAGREASVVPEEGGVCLRVHQVDGVLMTRGDIDALVRFLVDLPDPTPPEHVKPHDPFDPTPSGTIVVNLNVSGDPDEIADEIRRLITERQTRAHV